MEQGSEHPLGAAIVEAARARNLTLSPVTGFESVTGQGVSGEVEGHVVIAGTQTFLADRGVDMSALDADASALRSGGASAQRLRPPRGLHSNLLQKVQRNVEPAIQGWNWAGWGSKNLIL